MADNSDDILIQVGTDLTTIKRQLRQLGQDITSSTSGYSKSFETFGKRLDTAVNTTAMQAQINKVTGVIAKSAKEWTGALSSVPAELDAIRTKFSPLYAAQQQYLANLKEIKSAHAIGAISANEMAVALVREKAAFASNVVAMSNTNKAHGRLNGTIKLTSNQMLNLSRQGNDVITMFALGAPPMQIFASQAGQIYDALEQGQGGVAGSLKAAGAAIVGFISPAGLAATALVGLAGAVIAYGVSGADSIESLDEILKRHADNIKLLGDSYEEASLKQKKLAVVSPDTFNLLSEADAKKMQERLKQSISDIWTGATEIQLSSMGGAMVSEEVIKAKFAPFTKAITDLENSAKDVTALRAFSDTVTELARSNPEYTDAANALLALGQSVKSSSKTVSDGAFDVAQAMLGASQPVDDFSDAINRFNAQMASVTSKTLQAALQEIFDKAKDGKLSIEEINDAIAVLEQENPSFAGIIEALKKITLEAYGASNAVAAVMQDGGKGPKGGRHVNPIEIASDRAVQNAQYSGASFMPTPAPNREDLGAAYDKAYKKAHKPAKAPKKTADDRFFEDIESIRQRTAALAQETAMVGMSYEAQTKRETAFDLEQTALKQVREEARKKGDQDWQNAQLTPDQVAKINEVSTAYAAQAETLRKTQEAQEELEDWMNVGKAATRGFIDDLIEGKSAGEAFANVLKKIGDNLLDLAMNDLFGKGGNSGLGIIGSLFGLGGGGGGFSAASYAGIGQGLFSSGGYTGPGGVNDPAGIVHKGEVVWSQSDISKAGGVAAVEAMRRNGGVSAPVMPRITSATSQSGPNITYAPQIDARGADSAAVARLEQVVARQQQEFSANVLTTMRKAKSTRNWK